MQHPSIAALSGILFSHKMYAGFKFNFFDSLLKLASSIIFYLLNLSATCFFTLVNTVECGLKP